jgi:hypothetical protein
MTYLNGNRQAAIDCVTSSSSIHTSSLFSSLSFLISNAHKILTIVNDSVRSATSIPGQIHLPDPKGQCPNLIETCSFLTFTVI